MTKTFAGRRLFGAALPILALLITDAAAQEVKSDKAAKPASTEPQPAPQTTLTGDWGGFRTQLHNMGVDITSGYKGEFLTTVFGAHPQQAAHSGELDLAATIDTGKLWGIAGGTMQTTVTLREGEPPPGDLLQQSEEVYGRDNIARLTEFWWRQKFLNDSLTIKFGRMPQGDFNNFSCDFMNLTFCGAPAGNIVGAYWYNWPIAQWAGWARYDFGDYNVMGGVYEVNPTDLDQIFAPGLYSGATGAMGHLEFGWTSHFGSPNLVGHYQIGVWDDTAGAPDVLIGVNGKPFALTGLAAMHRSDTYGIYVQGVQQITGKGVYDRDAGYLNQGGVGVFFNFIQADRATSTLDSQVTAGMTYVGPIAQRPNDAVGLAVGRTGYNSRAAQSLELATPGVEVPRAEYPIEAFYSFQATPWWDVRPDVQYVIHPGGYTHAANETLIGFRTDVKF